MEKTAPAFMEVAFLWSERKPKPTALYRVWNLKVPTEFHGTWINKQKELHGWQQGLK